MHAYIKLITCVYMYILSGSVLPFPPHPPAVSVEFIESMMRVVEAERRLSVCLVKRGTTTLDAEVAVTTCDRTGASIVEGLGTTAHTACVD